MMVWVYYKEPCGEHTHIKTVCLQDLLINHSMPPYAIFNCSEEQELSVVCFTGQAAVKRDVLALLTPGIGESWDCRLEFSTQIKNPLC